MCGIAGFIKKRNASLESYGQIAKRMVDAIRWRGPDASDDKIWANGDKVVAFAHCRLSVMDLSDNGKQPMETIDGQYSITFNGEIYNHGEIKKELEKLGYAFKSTCDTEALLYACVEWGVEATASKCNGMFAFAFYDRAREQVYLCRDRMGVKPLYYYVRDGQLAFASDLRALMALPDFIKKIDRRMVYGFLWNMHVPAPYTVFHGAYKLESGTCLRYDIKTGRIDKERFWEIGRQMSASDKGDDDYFAFREDIKRQLKDAVKVRLEADVPVGVFLSGGIDSSLVSALAQEAAERRISTYSIGFREKSNDDALYARCVSKILGTDHTEVYCTESDALDLIEHIPKAYSEPFSDNSLLPTMLLSRLTKEHVTVALSGDGGDELFVGYPSYLTQHKLYRLHNLAKIWAKTGGWIAKKMMSMYSHNRWKSDKFSNATSAENIKILDFITAMRILDSILPMSENEELYAFEKHMYSGSARESESFLTQAVMQSMEVGLQDDMLVKVDRASMYYSLEIRCPMLDYRVVEKAVAAPFAFKCKDGSLKAPLKDILSDYVPMEIINRPKMGFGMPVDEWLHGKWSEIVKDYLSRDYITRQGIFSPEGIERFVKEFMKRRNPALNKIAFSILMFQLWWDEYR